jgi:hypothetical protein
MAATFNKTPILFAALLTMATPAFAGDWWTTPGGLRFATDGACALKGNHLECEDAAGNVVSSYSAFTVGGSNPTLSQRHLADIATNPELKGKRLGNFRHFVLDYIKSPPTNKNLGELQLDLKQVGSMWAFVATFKSDDNQGATMDTVLLETWYDGHIIKIDAVGADTEATVGDVYNSLQTLEADQGADNSNTFQNRWRGAQN